MQKIWHSGGAVNDVSGGHRKDMGVDTGLSSLCIEFVSEAFGILLGMITRS